MKDYARIASKIVESVWLITPHSLDLILDIVDARMKGVKLTDEELGIKLQETGAHGNGSTTGNIGGGVGVLPIYGPIFGKANMMTELSGATSLETFRNDLKQMVADPNIKSILLDIDSPGGTNEMLRSAGDEIFAARNTKPVIAIANSLAGSAAYWLGSQASELYVVPDGMVGSVGAYTVHEDQSVKDANEGRRFTFISAGPFKTEGNPHEPLSREGAAYRKEVIDEIYNNFLEVVARGRGTSVDDVRENYGGGRVIPSNHALASKMVDGEIEYDALVQSMVSKPSQISVPVSVNGKFYQAKLDSKTGIIDVDLTTGQEHAEPGTGTPPDPVPQPSDMGAIGSRRGDLPEGFPNENDQPGAPRASNVNNGGTMTEDQLRELYQLFNVSDEAALLTAIRDLHTTSEALSSDVSLAAEELAFKTNYPNVWEKMQKDSRKLLETDADNFLSAHKMFANVEDGKITPSKIGLSALASDTVRETYLKFASSEGTLEDFTKCIHTITQGGFVEYGERGSNLTSETEGYTIDTDTAAGIQRSRQLFASKVAEIQASDGLDFKAALLEAGKRFPDLAEAYRATAKA